MLQLYYLEKTFYGKKFFVHFINRTESRSSNENLGNLITSVQHLQIFTLNTPISLQYFFAYRQTE